MLQQVGPLGPGGFAAPPYLKSTDNPLTLGYRPPGVALRHINPKKSYKYIHVGREGGKKRRQLNAIKEISTQNTIMNGRKVKQNRFMHILNTVDLVGSSIIISAYK